MAEDWKKNDAIMVQGCIKQKKYKQINSAAKCADCKYKVMISVEHGTLVQNCFLLMITFRIKAPSWIRRGFLRLNVNFKNKDMF